MFRPCISCAITLLAFTGFSNSALSEPLKESEPVFSREGLLGLGLHLQGGLGLGTILGTGETRVQAHPRVGLRYDRDTYALRLVYRHQRLASVDTPSALLNVGHAEISFSPGIVFQFPWNSRLAFEGGAGLSLGVFSKYQLESEVDSSREFGIPITGEIFGTLVWQWRQGMSFEWSADYRPLFYGDGDLEHFVSNSLTLSVDF